MSPSSLELIYHSSSFKDILLKEDELTHLADSLFEGDVDIHSGWILGDNDVFKLQFRVESVCHAEHECKTD